MNLPDAWGDLLAPEAALWAFLSGGPGQFWSGPTDGCPILDPSLSKTAQNILPSIK